MYIRNQWQKLFRSGLQGTRIYRRKNLAVSTLPSLHRETAPVFPVLPGIKRVEILTLSMCKNCTHYPTLWGSPVSATMNAKSNLKADNPPALMFSIPHNGPHPPSTMPLDLPSLHIKHLFSYDIIYYFLRLAELAKRPFTVELCEFLGISVCSQVRWYSS